ncbi:MAG: sporulation membrane protein YtaF [Bacillota bacterium]|jgi:putative sporulation protein YtaF
MELLTVIVFALALNMDAFGTGIAYGVRNIKLPLSSLLIISAMSVLAIVISMAAGQLLLQFIPPNLAEKMGGAILLLIGLWILYQSLTANHSTDKQEEVISEEVRTVNGEQQTLFKIHIKFLGLVIQILKEPARADLDRSGVISWREALLLGLALALDAFAAGFAVSMLGFGILLTAIVVGLGHIILTYLGLLFGRGVGAMSFGRQFSALPGCILIALGLFKLY